MQPVARRSLRPDRWTFFVLGSLMLLIVGIGYGPHIFVAGVTRPEMHSAIIRIHVVFVSLWLCTFATQVLFAILGKLSWHRRFGSWAFLIASIWVITALLALAVLLHQDPNAGPESFILLTRIGIFAGFLAMAWVKRRQPAAHKRWMVLAMSQAIIGGIRQLPIAWLQGSQVHSTEAALLFPLALIVYDLAKTKRIHPATIYGSAIIFAVQLVRFPISTTQAWLVFAHWIGSLGL